MKKILVLLVFCPLWVSAQSNYATLNESYYHLIDRYEIKSGQIIPYIFTSVKPYMRSDIAAFLDSANQLGVFTSRSDQFNFAYFQNDSWEWTHAETSNSRKPLLKYFYKKKSDFLYVDKDPDFDLHVSPVLYLGAGNDSEADDYLFINTRGIELRGMLDKKIGFYLYMTDNQKEESSYVANTIENKPDVGHYPVLPHEGFWKGFKDNKGYDFLHTRGYVTFAPTRHFSLQFGHDRIFIGNGQRSLIFSDYAPPSLFLKGNVKVWRLNYLFSLHRMVADVDGNSSGLKSSGKYPDKFVALHHLSINIGKKWNLGLFESVVFTDTSSFEWSYLNPIIFYRAIEQQFGSSDNVILGMDFKWNALKGVSIYGQFVLDEFLLDNLKQGNGWWANKYGIQAGVKYIDAFGVSNLDLQAETNIVRPYTYSHDTPYGNYSSYLQPIAHPLGANFKEFIGIVRYQPIPKLNLTGKLMMMQVGRDSTSVNWGGDILKDNKTKEQDYNNTIAQGVRNDILFATFTATWQVWHNVFIDASVVFRQSESPVPFYNKNTSVTSLALRWNIAQRLYEF